MSWFFVFKKLKHKTGFIAGLLLFFLFIWLAINNTFVQNYLVKKVTQTLSNNLQTKINIKHVNFSLFNKIIVEGIFLQDKKNDTLLYAGIAKANITDWFFTKDKIVLQYIYLKDVYAKINRIDSVWNYQFLLDYFSSPKKNSTTKDTLQLDFKKVELANIHLTKTDNWIGNDLQASIGTLKVDADSFNLSKKNIALNKIVLDNAVYAEKNYTGAKPKTIKVLTKKTSSNLLKWNEDDWRINVKNIQITNSQFATEIKNNILPTTNHFDGEHILFSAINANIKKVNFIKDTLSGDIILSAKERSGLQVKQLQTLLKFNPQKMEFNNLKLVTNKSKIENYYAMAYDGFNKSMADFIHNVTLNAQFENAQVHTDDIAFFAPELKPWNRKFIIKGNVRGTIENLTAKNLIIKSNNTTLDGSIALKGLPDIKTTFIDFKANKLVTTYADITTFVPSLKNITQPNLTQLGNINFKGNFTGFINDFVTYGNIGTALGNIDADINMKLPETKTATYAGKISTTKFNLAQFLNDNTFGNIALDGTIEGSGFSQTDVKAKFKGNIRQINFRHYNYSNIIIDGDFNKAIFTGRGSIDDPNINVKNFNGSMSLLAKQPTFKFDADFLKLDFKKLYLTNEQFDLTGHFSLNFTGNNIDNFLGSAKIYNALLLHNNAKLSFDSLTLNSFLVGDKKSLTIQSNELEANFTGNFKLKELPDAFKVFLSKYYPAYIDKPKNTIANQNFSFLIKSKQVDDYVQLLDKNLKGFNNATLSGNLNLAANELNVNATIPNFTYANKVFNIVSIESKGNLNSLKTKILASDIIVNDSLRFPETNLSIISQNDISEIGLKTSASKTLSQAELNATVKTLADGVSIHFSPSSFIINDKKWLLEKNGELIIRKSYLHANEIKFKNDDQAIVFSTEEATDGTDNTNIVAKLKNINIYDFTPFFITTPRLEGELTGSVILKNPFGKQVLEYNTVAQNFILDNKFIGNTNLCGDADLTTGLLKINASADNEKNKFNIAGSINYKDTTNNLLNIGIVTNRFDLSILNNYLGNIFSNMQGDAVSNLKITGGAKHQSYTGNVLIKNASLKVNYTQCNYKFTNQTIVFEPGVLNLGIIQLKDSLNNTGALTGKIYFNNLFDNLSFDHINFETTKMLLLNTTEKDNNQFYGKVIGRSSMDLNGPVTDMTMKINGEPSILDTSHIYLPTGSSQESGVVDYIDFIQFGTQMESIKNKQGTNIFLDMNLKANPACKIDVILDAATGDVIKGRGNGLLNITVGTKEPLSIRGKYDITDGDYKFNFQTFIQKYFSIKKGSITWNGDPFLAQINIDADYLAPHVDLSSLATSSGGKLTNQKSDIDIVAHLTNTLKEPKIAFDFVIPKDKQTEGTNDPILQENLKKFTKDENEQNRQVASLLLFNSFLNDNAGGFSASTYSFISGTVGQVISGFLNNQLTKFFQKVIKDPTITPYLSFNSNYNLTSTELINALEASGNFGFKKEYYNGRLLVSLGGNIDYNNPYILQQKNTNVLLTPDLTIEYLLTKDGKLRIVGFNRTDVDVTLGQRNRTGMRLSYQKEFDKKRKNSYPILKN